MFRFINADSSKYIFEHTIDVDYEKQVGTFNFFIFNNNYLVLQEREDGCVVFHPGLFLFLFQNIQIENCDININLQNSLKDHFYRLFNNEVSVITKNILF